VNNRGTVIGGNSTPSFGGTGIKWSSSGAITDLGTLPDGSQSNAADINDLDVIVGSGDSNGDIHAVRWDCDGRITDLGALPNLPFDFATKINDAGTAIGLGFSADRSIQHALVWN
jgi:uncharacterized membrane protein